MDITRLKDGLIHIDVDYQADKSRLEKAKKRRTWKFIYVSGFKAKFHRDLKILEANCVFVD